MIGSPDGSANESTSLIELVRSAGREVGSQHDRDQRQGKLMIIEGNIGVGKTTLARKLAKHLKYTLYLEPTVENPYLEKFYADPKKYALKLQLWILRQRYLTYVAALKHVVTTGEGVILDRSVFGDCVFANVCTKEGYISAEGYQQYVYWRHKAIQHLPRPHVTLFLDASPKCCYDRLRQRGRSCESAVPLDYLTKLHEEYQKFVKDMRTQGLCVLKYEWSIFGDEKLICRDIEAASVLSWELGKHLKINERSIPSDSEHTLEVLLDEED